MALGDPRIKINLDIGHANLSKHDFSHWIKVLGDNIAYMHLHDNNGIHDEHKPLGEAKIERLYQELNDLKLKPVLSLEYKVEDLRQEIGKYV